MIREEAPEITRVIGIAMAGVPIAAGMSFAGGIPGGFTRKMDNVKSLAQFREVITTYGEHAMLEGELTSGDNIALVDDLVTRFDSKLLALEQVKYEVQKEGSGTLNAGPCLWCWTVNRAAKKRPRNSRLNC